MIGVIKKNFQETTVDDYVLDSLIVSKKILAFCRSSEWVVVDRDPVRKQSTFFPGEERRKTIQGDNFFMR